MWSQKTGKNMDVMMNSHANHQMANYVTGTQADHSGFADIEGVMVILKSLGLFSQ